MTMVDRVEKLSEDQRPLSSRLPASSPVSTVSPRLHEHRVRDETPCETSRKSVSYTDSSTISTARWRILSSYVGIPSGRVSVGEPALGMCTRRTGGATYVPIWRGRGGSGGWPPG